jgi:hypothetical protein
MLPLVPPQMGKNMQYHPTEVIIIVEFLGYKTI